MYRIKQNMPRTFSFSCSYAYAYNHYQLLPLIFYMVCQHVQSSNVIAPGRSEEISETTAPFRLKIILRNKSTAFLLKTDSANVPFQMVELELNRTKRALLFLYGVLKTAPNGNDSIRQNKCPKTQTDINPLKMAVMSSLWCNKDRATESDNRSLPSISFFLCYTDISSCFFLQSALFLKHKCKLKDGEQRSVVKADNLWHSNSFCCLEGAVLQVNYKQNPNSVL